MVSAEDRPSGIPEGFKEVYRQDFEGEAPLKDFLFSDPAAWKLSETNGNKVLELAGKSRYQPPHRSPFNIALLAEPVVGDFILEADLLQTGKEYGHRDMCLFFGFKSLSQFFYAHLATQADDHAHNVFVVNEAPRRKFGSFATGGVNWGLNAWHKVRIERKGTEVRVFFDDLSQAVIRATTEEFRKGHVGLGSFDDTGMVDNIRVWAPEVEFRKAGSFAVKTTE